MNSSATYSLLAIREFEKASRKANWRDWLSWLTRNNNNLLSLDEILRCVPVKNQRHLGFQFVPIDKIVGSEGRHRDFDRAFLPRQTHTKGRWISIGKAHYKAVSLPPVDLVKMGQDYFVRDGNHRVSVARVRGQEVIDAYVTEIVTSLSADDASRGNC